MAFHGRIRCERRVRAKVDRWGKVREARHHRGEALDDLGELGFGQDLWKCLENPSHNFPGPLKCQDAFDPQLVYLVYLISMELERNFTAFL